MACAISLVHGTGNPQRHFPFPIVKTRPIAGATDTAGNQIERNRPFACNTGKQTFDCVLFQLVVDSFAIGSQGDFKGCGRGFFPEDFRFLFFTRWRIRFPGTPYPPDHVVLPALQRETVFRPELFHVKNDGQPSLRCGIKAQYGDGIVFVNVGVKALQASFQFLRKGLSQIARVVDGRLADCFFTLV